MISHNNRLNLSIEINCFTQLKKEEQFHLVILILVNSLVLLPSAMQINLQNHLLNTQ